MRREVRADKADGCAPKVEADCNSALGGGGKKKRAHKGNDGKQSQECWQSKSYPRGVCQALNVPTRRAIHRSLIHLFICSFIHPFVHSFIHLLIHSFPHSSTHSLANLRLRVRLVRNLVGKKVADSCRDAGGVNAIDSDLEKRERKRETLNCVIRVFVSLCSVLFCSGVSCVFSASLSLPGSPFCKTQTAASARSGST